MEKISQGIGSPTGLLRFQCSTFGCIGLEIASVLTTGDFDSLKNFNLARSGSTKRREGGFATFRHNNVTLRVHQ
jgi:hypothetical protein